MLSRSAGTYPFAPAVGHNQYMHAGLILFIALGVAFGWVWKRGHYAYLDLKSAKGRLKGARAVFRREVLWTGGVIVAALLVVRALA